MALLKGGNGAQEEQLAVAYSAAMDAESLYIGCGDGLFVCSRFLSFEF